MLPTNAALGYQQLPALSLLFVKSWFSLATPVCRLRSVLWFPLTRWRYKTTIHRQKYLNSIKWHWRLWNALSIATINSRFPPFFIRRPARFPEWRQFPLRFAWVLIDFESIETYHLEVKIVLSTLSVTNVKNLMGCYSTSMLCQLGCWEGLVIIIFCLLLFYY